jgi:DNA-binding MarR family transcriptional regulator
MPLQEQIIAALRQIAQAVDTRSRQLLTEFGLSSPQIGTLRELARCGGCSPSELAEALHLSPQTMAGILQRLELRGLVGRERDPSDKRSFVVRLTEAGTKAEATAPQLLRDEFTAQLEKLPAWEQSQMLATLQRIAHMMHAEDIEPMPFLHTERDEFGKHET